MEALTLFLKGTWLAISELVAVGVYGGSIIRNTTGFLDVNIVAKPEME